MLGLPFRLRLNVPPILFEAAIIVRGRLLAQELWRSCSDHRGVPAVRLWVRSALEAAALPEQHRLRARGSERVLGQRGVVLHGAAEEGEEVNAKTKHKFIDMTGISEVQEIQTQANKNQRDMEIKTDLKSNSKPTSHRV